MECSVTACFELLSSFEKHLVTRVYQCEPEDIVKALELFCSPKTEDDFRPEVETPLRSRTVNVWQILNALQDRHMHGRC